MGVTSTLGKTLATTQSGASYSIREAPSNPSLVVETRTVRKETSEVGSPSAVADLKKSNRPLGARVAPSDSW